MSRAAVAAMARLTDVERVGSPSRPTMVSLFSGAGGADLGFERAGFATVAGCEKDRWARAVWRRHHPDVPVHDDVEVLDREWFDRNAVHRVDLVVGGSPCTDLSVAGQRRGLVGDASRLFWHQCRLADVLGAAWVVWENVPDVFSSNDGEDFAAVLWGLCGHRPAVPAHGWRSVGVCWGAEHVVVWRVLDAQWFGVAQRRRRVFAVRGPRALARRVVEVLLDADCLSGGPRPGRPTESGGSAAGAAVVAGEGVGLSGPLMAHHSRLDDCEVASGQIIASALTGQQVQSSDNPVGSLVVGALTARQGGADERHAAAGQLISFGHQIGGTWHTQVHDSGDHTRALISGQGLAIADDTVVRRLTEVERERLMGWPDDWTAWGIGDGGAGRDV